MFRPKVTCYVDTDLVHTSFFTAGLIECANRGQIRLAFAPGLWSLKPNPHRGLFTVLVKIKLEHNERFVCVDMHDSATYFSEQSLKLCRRYYKVNYRKDIVDALPVGDSEKVKPFFPYFACRPVHDRNWLLRTAGSFFETARKRGYRFSKQGIVTLYGISVSRFKRYMQRLSVDEYWAQNAAERRGVFFNPGCWNETSPAIRETNAFRAAIIRRLKTEIPEQFIGGFVPSKIAQEHYPDLVMSARLNHPQYIGQLHQAEICIYSNGLDRCISWKLGEYLAAGTFIVGETLANSLAKPIGDGFIEFETPDDCVDRILNLLADEQTLRKGQESNSAYYRDFSSPAASACSVIASELVREAER